MNRRKFLTFSAGMLSLPLFFINGRNAMADPAQTGVEKINLDDREWKKRLSDQQYNVLRREGTEPPFTSPLNDEKHTGMFVCAGCNLELFPSQFKFNSGTGWPSFYDVIPGHVETRTDYKLLYPRTEYHCARCGGHHGHVFSDGPEPTGLRYCNNGAALKFIPEKS
ncbi:MAG: peptide-methionine (R)-S-oxide reductase [Alphaproteobacteria bacterium]|nr:MAG: peptide-methionine (R)-S-oxide reductase [Alphaproteobacteria bacterium]